MVTVVNYAVRQSSDGNSFVALMLQGDLEMVQSQVTGKFYATARRCSISSTFDEATASLIIGKQIPGTILKENCDPYDYVIQETGEKVTLHFRYTYSPTEQSVTDSQGKNPQVPIPAFNLLSASAPTERPQA